MSKYQKTEHSHTIYSKAELAAIRNINQVKIFFLHPLIVVLDKARVTPNQVSAFSALAIIIGFVLSFILANPFVFVIAIWIHLIIDSIDGTLARYQKISSFQGAVIDAFCDHFGVVFASIFISMYSIVDFRNMVIFVILYTFLIWISVALLKRKQPFNFIIRPRLLVYLAMTIDVVWYTTTTSYIVLLVNIIMLVEVSLGVVKFLSSKKIHL